MANDGGALPAQAAKALRELSGIAVTYDSATETLTLDLNDRRTTFHVQTVTTLTKAKQAELIGGADRGDSVTVVGALTGEQAWQLRQAGLNYVDTAGNAHLKADDAIVFVDGQKAASLIPDRRSVGRAFQPAGLKVLFVLLADPSRANETYRDLAARVDVSPATVKHVLDDLERRGNVVKVGRGRGMSRRLVGVSDPAKRWAESYGDVLRPKLLRGRYRFLDANQVRDWKNIVIDRATSCWGGEAAADLHEGQLRPEVLTLYSTSPTARVARALRIVPDADGTVEVLDKFWVDDIEVLSGQPAAPKLLAIADLLASRQTRNLEAALRLFDSWADAVNAQQ